MEMDCYPEYKHHIHPNHQHYSSNNAATNHPYYPGNYGPASMRYAHAHAPFENGGGQQPAWTDNYTRYNQAQQHHHLNHHGNYSSNSFNGHYGAAREGFHANAEGSGQFYYQNAHQASPGYYGNHSYDSYRNASPSGYHYHYGAGGGNTNYHQTASAPSQYYPPSYNAAAEQQFNNRYYPTPPPSTPPTSTQRDPYLLAQHPNEAASASPYTPSTESDLNDKQLNERLSCSDTKSTLNDPVASASSPHHSPLVRQSTESGEKDEKQATEVQQTKAEEPLHEASAPKSDEGNENSNESVKAEDKKSNDDESDSRADDQSASLINETTDHNPLQFRCNESLTKADSLKSQDTANDVENSAATGKRERENEGKAVHELSISEKKKRNCLVFIYLGSHGSAWHLDSSLIAPISSHWIQIRMNSVPRGWCQQPHADDFAFLFDLSGLQTWRLLSRFKTKPITFFPTNSSIMASMPRKTNSYRLQFVKSNKQFPGASILSGFRNQAIVKLIYY